MKNSVLLPIGLLLSCAMLATAAPKKRPAVKKAKPALKANAPIKLDDGVVILGEGSVDLPPAQRVVISAERPANLKGAGASAATPSSDAGARLVQFCRSYMGRKLGNGQCTELPTLGLPAIGSPLLPNYVWGDTVCQYTAVGGRPTFSIGPLGKSAAHPNRPDVRPGDIIQYEGVRFEKNWDTGYSFTSYPHHTSVIESVSRDGFTYKVLEQNVNNTQFVLESKVFMPDMKEGTMRISRPLAGR